MEENLLNYFLDEEKLAYVDNPKILSFLFRFFKNIVDFSYDEIAVTDNTGKILYLNSAAENNYGAFKKDLLGKHSAELEKKGIVFPVITPIVIKKKCRIAIIQETCTGNKFAIGANPVFNDNGEIEMIITNSRIISGLDTNELKKTTRTFINSAYDNKPFKNIITKNQKMKNIFKTCKKVARTEVTVLLLGESGVGKDLIANAIHSISLRENNAYVKVNCGSISPTLIESELFGYEGGAFTGAKKEGKKGLLEIANNGTFFLDEIADLPKDLQVKLLHVLQEKRFIRVGGTKPIELNLRFIAATNRNLIKMVEEGQFRKDLFYRLSVVPIEIPPLRERKEDIFPLSQYFLKKFNEKYCSEKYLSLKVLERFLLYDWPGNIRELENVLENLVVTTSSEEILESSLPTYLRSIKPSKKTNSSLNKIVEDIKAQIVQDTYQKLGSSYKVAKVLGVSQSTAHRLIKKFVNSE